MACQRDAGDVDRGVTHMYRPFLAMSMLILACDDA